MQERLWRNILKHWHVDSGCSRHMTGDISQLTNLEHHDGGDVIFAGGSKGKIIQRGTVSNGALTLENVNYVPELKHSQLSVSQMSDKGYSSHFTSKECIILNSCIIIREEWILVKAQRRQDAYFLDMNQQPSKEVVCLFSKLSEQTAMLWHRRLGRANLKNLNRIAKGNIVRNLPIKEFIMIEKCVASAKGKHHRKPHNSKIVNSIDSLF